MNDWAGIGRTTKDIELRYTKGGTPYATFTLAVNRKRKDGGADFIPCKAWTKTAELLSQYVPKGARIAVSGRLETSSFEKDGQRIDRMEVIAEDIEFLERRQSDAAEPEGAKTAQPSIDEFASVEASW